MAERSAAQLVDIRLVEEKRIDESNFQDYAKVHERLDRVLEKEPRPLPEARALAQADAFVAWLAGQSAKNVPDERLSQLLRCGLGHICSDMIAAPPSLSLEEIAARAYAELQRRGWDAAVFDPEVAAEAVKRGEEAAKAAPPRSRAKKVPTPTAQAAGAENKVREVTPKVAVAMASPKAAPAKKEAPMIEKKTPAKPAAAKKAAPAKKAARAEKKPAAKKVAAAKKPAAKKAVAEKKPVAKKAVAAKKPVAKKAVAEKKPVAKKVVAAKKPVAKKAVAEKKPVAKKAAAEKKPVVKKAAAPKKAPKPAAEPKPAPASAPVVVEEKKPEQV